MVTDPVVVYYGTHTECVFLRSLLEGSGIHVFTRDFGTRGFLGEQLRVFVERADLGRALPLVEHFKQHGQKTD
jgi:hypothetical protein